MSTALGYLQNHKDKMRYPEYRRRGLPITSAYVESAVKQFNEREHTPRPAVYGCVTTGTQWLFLKLEGDNLFIDSTQYYLHDLPKLLGILVHITRDESVGAKK